MYFLKVSIVLLIAGSTLSACSKENWVRVSDEFYVDAASAKRNGDIAQVTIKYKRELDSLDFDCIKNQSIDYPNIDMDEKDSLTVGLSKSMKIACSRWFEVWKK